MSGKYYFNQINDVSSEYPEDALNRNSINFSASEPFLSQKMPNQQTRELLARVHALEEMLSVSEAENQALREKGSDENGNNQSPGWASDNPIPALSDEFALTDAEASNLESFVPRITWLLGLMMFQSMSSLILER